MSAVLRMLLRGRSRHERVRGWLMSTGAGLAVFLLCTAVGLVSYQDEGGSLTGLALALLTVPVAGLLHQANRLASATRERRLAALRLAGALLYVVARLGQPPAQVPVVVAVVVLGGVLSGARAGRQVVASPLGLVRRSRVRGPRPLDLVLAVAGAAMVGAGITVGFRVVGAYSTAVLIAAGMVLLLFGLVLAATWLIRAVARTVGRRAGSPETLLAARVVEADPRAWARALSVVALTVFFGAGAGAQQAAVSYSHAHALVDLALLVALATSAVALVVHQAEELLDHRRSFAALAASGVPERALGRVLVRQAVIAAVPVCAVAAVAGAALVIVSVAEIYQVGWLAWAAARAVAMAGIGVLAAVLVALAARPLLRGALRTEGLRRS